MTLEAQVADLEFRLREVVREREEAYADRRRARAEHDKARRYADEARAELVSTSQQLELEREHSARLSRECQERHDELRAEVERLERLFQQTHGVHHSWVDARHKVAERQREACAKAAQELLSNYVTAERVADAVRATPLVTEGEP